MFIYRKYYGINKYIKVQSFIDWLDAQCSTVDYGDEVCGEQEGFLPIEEEFPRNDPDLIDAIERFPSGWMSVIEIPDDVDWEICTDHTCEWVAEKHRCWYSQI